MTLGGLKTGDAPITGKGSTVFTDALPQALILTAIVIGFAVNAFFLVILYRSYDEKGRAITVKQHGPDDYITKPLNEDELLARMEALLCRRTPTNYVDITDIRW